MYEHEFHKNAFPEVPGFSAVKIASCWLNVRCILCSFFRCYKQSEQNLPVEHRGEVLRAGRHFSKSPKNVHIHLVKKGRKKSPKAYIWFLYFFPVCRQHSLTRCWSFDVVYLFQSCRTIYITPFSWWEFSIFCQIAAFLKISPKFPFFSLKIYFLYAAYKVKKFLLF